jgi:hypothetical protein
MMDRSEQLINESNFYSSPFKFSYSSLNRLLYAPTLFYTEYVLGMKEIRTDAHLIEGKLIHYLILDSALFSDKFILASGQLPGDSVKSVVDIVYEVIDKGEDKALDDYSDIILVTLAQINLYQKFVDDKKPDKEGIQKTANQKRLEKVLITEAREYFEFLKVKGTKDIIDQSTLDKCTRAAEILKSNSTIIQLLALDKVHDGTTLGIYNELAVDGPLEGFPFGIKGIIDNMVVDVTSKTVTINDLKTSHKSLNDFSESVDYWNYWMQAAMYKKLAKIFLKDVIDDTWLITFNFIVIDKYNQTYAFRVTNTTMEEWSEKLDNQLMEARWHYENRDYTLPYKFISGEVLL